MQKCASITEAVLEKSVQEHRVNRGVGPGELCFFRWEGYSTLIREQKVERPRDRSKNIPRV